MKRRMNFKTKTLFRMLPSTSFCSIHKQSYWFYAFIYRSANHYKYYTTSFYDPTRTFNCPKHCPNPDKHCKTWKFPNQSIKSKTRTKSNFSFLHTLFDIVFWPFLFLKADRYDEWYICILHFEIFYKSVCYILDTYLYQIHILRPFYKTIRVSSLFYRLKILHSYIVLGFVKK